MATNLSWALSYADLGWPVFPCRVMGKEPLTAHGLLDATTDEAMIREWWGQWPAANVATRIPDGHLVLDFDDPTILARYILGNDYTLPATVKASTARGYHFWFAHNIPGLRSGKIEEGVDIKAGGGYVLLPPSVHPTGAQYQWEVTPRNTIAPAPEWLLEKLRANDGATVKEAVSVQRVFDGLPSGERNAELFRYACRLRRKGMEREEAEVLVTEAGLRCRPPMKAHELATIVASAWRYEPGDVARAGSEVEVLTIGEIMEKEYPPISWIIPGLVPEGFVVLAASPKIGKSWFALQLCFALACGGRFMRQYQATLGQALYMDLEQPPRRTQARIRTMAGAPTSGVWFTHQWPKYQQGGFAKLDEWLGQHPDCRLVVVDVLAKLVGAKPTNQGGNAYDQEYTIYSELKSITDKHQITTVAIHHDNKTLADDKFDRISGSRALLAVADAALVLTRRRGDLSGELFAAGREVEDQMIALEFDPYQKAWKANGQINTNTVAEAQSWRAAVERAVAEAVTDEETL